MSIRPLGPPPIVPDDPGPWSMVTHVYHQIGRPGRRRPPPPAGLMLSPPPEIGWDNAGIAPHGQPAGAGRVRVVAAAREPALALSVDDDGERLRAISPYVLRSFSLPDLVLASEERPGDDPAAALPGPVMADALRQGPLPDPVASAPGGELVAVFAREARHHAIGILRPADRAVVRWIRGARAAAWTPDGTHLAVGGEWGVMLLVARSDG